MLSWFDKMEKKVGRYAISNLTLYLLIAYGIGYMTRFLMPELLQWLTLEPGLILKGQIWRIVSWIFVAPAEKPIYFLLMVWLYYSLGTTLERTWGTFRYNVYIISGMFLLFASGITSCLHRSVCGIRFAYRFTGYPVCVT